MINITLNLHKLDTSLSWTIFSGTKSDHLRQISLFKIYNRSLVEYDKEKIEIKCLECTQLVIRTLCALIVHLL